MARIPFDPADLDRIPPDDLATCPRCNGVGALFPTADPADAVGCPRCGGDGTLPEWEAS